MNILTHMTYYELLIFSGYVLQAELLMFYNETNINPIKIHCCLWLTFWILNNTHNAPLLSRGLPQVTFDLPGTCWIQIKCRFVLLRLNKLNPSIAKQSSNFNAESAYCIKCAWLFRAHEWKPGETQMNHNQNNNSLGIKRIFHK